MVAGLGRDLKVARLAQLKGRLPRRGDPLVRRAAEK
jgi:hypothetical protein